MKHWIIEVSVSSGDRVDIFLEASDEAVNALLKRQFSIRPDETYYGLARPSEKQEDLPSINLGQSIFKGVGF